MSTLSQVWNQVETLLADGVSLIPVRDKDEVNKYGDTLVAKSAYNKWKEFQNRQMTKEELWHSMEEKDTNAVAIICGKISGNMEVIDIDVKYNPGIDAVLFADLQSFYPDLFAKLRIHKTPSGGYHIIYRVDQAYPVPGSYKLAGRYATDEEIQAQIDRGAKRPNKEVNFLETRGEAGYILSPPSLGYALHNNNDIPVISWEERCSIIRLCESYTTIIKEAPKLKPTKTEESWYDENPFEHYNKSKDPTELVTEYGWKFSHENNSFIWYTRPDKQRGVSLSWNKEKHIFYVFTSSTELASEKGYHPSSILAELGFAGDKSLTYKWLIKNGYGIVKPSVEASIVKKAARAGNQNLPSNFSDNAKKLLIEEVSNLDERYPYGNFIKFDYETEKTTVSYEQLYTIAAKLGIRLFGDVIVKIDGFRLLKITEREFQDVLKAYIHEEEVEVYEQYCNVFEKFIKENTKFILGRMTLLDETTIIKDDRNICFKYFVNGYVKIEADKIEFFDYSNIDGYVWDDKIQKREFSLDTNRSGLYRDFLVNATNYSDHVKNVVGYLSHEYKGEHNGYVIVLTEEVEDPKKGGGSGKNIFGNMFGNISTIKTVPGSSVSFDKLFLNSWNGERIYFLPDIPKHIDWVYLKEMATGTGNHKKMHKDEVSVPSDKMPKILINTNFSYDASDGGVERRIIPIEFTPYYTLNKGVDVVHNKLFPTDFNDEDWADFYWVIIECVQHHLKMKGKLSTITLTENGWKKQFRIKYTGATDFIFENFEDWTTKEFIKSDDFNKSLENYYRENNVLTKFQPSTQKLNDGIEEYAKKHGWNFNRRFTKKINSISSKGRLFYKGQAPEEDAPDPDAPF